MEKENESLGLIVSLFRELINLTEQRKQLSISLVSLPTIGANVAYRMEQRPEFASITASSREESGVVEVDVSGLCLVTLVNDSDVLDLVDAAILAVDATYVNNR